MFSVELTFVHLLSEEEFQHLDPPLIKPQHQLMQVLFVFFVTYSGKNIYKIRESGVKTELVKFPIPKVFASENILCCIH